MAISVLRSLLFQDCCGDTLICINTATDEPAEHCPENASSEHSMAASRKNSPMARIQPDLKINRQRMEGADRALGVILKIAKPSLHRLNPSSDPHARQGLKKVDRSSLRRLVVLWHGESPHYAHHGKKIGNRSNGHGFDSRQASHGKLTVCAVGARSEYRRHCICDPRQHASARDIPAICHSFLG